MMDTQTRAMRGTKATTARAKGEFACLYLLLRKSCMIFFFFFLLREWKHPFLSLSCREGALFCWDPGVPGK